MQPCSRSKLHPHQRPSRSPEIQQLNPKLPNLHSFNPTSPRRQRRKPCRRPAPWRRSIMMRTSRALGLLQSHPKTLMSPPPVRRFSSPVSRAPRRSGNLLPKALEWQAAQIRNPKRCAVCVKQSTRQLKREWHLHSHQSHLMLVRRKSLASSNPNHRYNMHFQRASIYESTHQSHFALLCNLHTNHAF